MNKILTISFQAELYIDWIHFLAISGSSQLGWYLLKIQKMFDQIF